MPLADIYTRRAGYIEFTYLATRGPVSITAYLEHYCTELDGGTVFHIHSN